MSSALQGNTMNPEALRSHAPNQADCKSAMAALLGTFDRLQGKA
jgi:hypothetical protein